jgi:hypothetical protein
MFSTKNIEIIHARPLYLRGPYSNYKNPVVKRNSPSAMVNKLFRPLRDTYNQLRGQSYSLRIPPKKYISPDQFEKGIFDTFKSGDFNEFTKKNFLDSNISEKEMRSLEKRFNKTVQYIRQFQELYHLHKPLKLIQYSYLALSISSHLFGKENISIDQIITIKDEDQMILPVANPFLQEYLKLNFDISFPEDIRVQYVNFTIN